MREIEFTGQFKRDYRREVKGRQGTTLEAAMEAILSDLTADKTLAPKYRDHRLTGNWTDHRDCHVRLIWC
jgi:mRNA interferase YafQ